MHRAPSAKACATLLALAAILIGAGAASGQEGQADSAAQRAPGVITEAERAALGPAPRDGGTARGRAAGHRPGTRARHRGGRDPVTPEAGQPADERVEGDTLSGVVPPSTPCTSGCSRSRRRTRPVSRSRARRSSIREPARLLPAGRSDRPRRERPSGAGRHHARGRSDPIPQPGGRSRGVPRGVGVAGPVEAHRRLCSTIARAGPSRPSARRSSPRASPRRGVDLMYDLERKSGRLGGGTTATSRGFSTATT